MHMGGAQNLKKVADAQFNRTTDYQPSPWLCHLPLEQAFIMFLNVNKRIY